MNSEIFSKIITDEDIEKLSDELDILQASLYKEKGRGFEIALNSKVRAWFAKTLRDEVTQQKIGIEDYLLQLRNELTKYKKITLILAYEPSASAIEHFHSIVQSYVGNRVVLDISYMPSLLAGVVIIFNGRYKNLSLKKAFEEEMKKNKEEIMGLLVSNPEINQQEMEDKHKNSISSIR